MGKCMHRLGLEEKLWETENDSTGSRHPWGSNATARVPGVWYIYQKGKYIVSIFPWKFYLLATDYS